MDGMNENRMPKLFVCENQKKLLMVAEEQIKYGEVVSDEELRKLDEEWMS